MDRNSIILGALAGAAVGAIIGASMNTEKGRQLVDDASQGIKNLGDRVSQYAKENIPGLKRETERTAYQGERTAYQGEL